MSQNTATVS